MIDGESRRIEHLDGAIRSYDAAEMLSRLDLNLMHVERKTDYKKLWRVDGDLDIRQWKMLIHNFFRGNPLIAEYFGQPSGSRNMPPELAEAQRVRQAGQARAVGLRERRRSASDADQARRSPRGTDL